MNTNGVAGKSATLTPQSAADAIAAFKADQAGKASGGSHAEIKTYPMSASKMDNEPEEVWIGSLRFEMHALTPRKAAALQSLMEAHYPAVFIYAAMGDEVGRGIDYALTAAFWQQVARAGGNESAIASEEDVALAIAAVSQRLARETNGLPVEGAKQRIVDTLAQMLLMVADTTPDLTAETLPTILEDSLTIPQFADAIRAIWYAVGGFPGSMSDRFGNGLV